MIAFLFFLIGTITIEKDKNLISRIRQVERRITVNSQCYYISLRSIFIYLQGIKFHVITVNVDVKIKFLLVSDQHFAVGVN